MTRVLGIIPARGGSKRIPRKNVRNLGGKPLIAYAIDQARQSVRLDETIVSTDEDEIRDTALEYGGTVPFERPSRLATDSATIHEVAVHALKWYSDRDETFDIVCSISTTTPFRKASDIDGAIKLLVETGVESVVSVTEFEYPPFWAVEQGEGGLLQPYFDELSPWSKTRIQEVPALYRPSGAVFAATSEGLQEFGGFYTDRTVGYEMPRERTFDIDEPFDLRVARALINEEDLQ